MSPSADTGSPRTSLRATGVAEPDQFSSLVRQGRSADVEVCYRPELGGPGAMIAAAVLARCEPDLTTLAHVFGGVRPAGSLRVILEPGVGATQAYRDRSEPNTLHCRAITDPAPQPRYSTFLVAVQLAELAAEQFGRGWSPDTASGAALARVLATSIYPRQAGRFATAAVWLNGERADRLSTAAGREDEDAVGCAVLFLHHLHTGLGFTWRQIAAAGGPSLAVVFRRLTGRLDDPFPGFAAGFAVAYPPGQPVALAGDNPYPLGVNPSVNQPGLTQPAVGSGAGPAAIEVESSTIAAPRPAPDLPALADALAHRRWWVCDTPFRHLRADEVFSADVHAGLAAEFERRLAAGQLTRSLPGYDASAAAVTPENAGALGLFLTREWHDSIAGLLGVEATGAVNVTLHHHAPGSASGRLHNDLNPGWFPNRPVGVDETLVHDPAVGNYQTGRSAGGEPMIEQVRAIALLYYLANPDDVQGGATGLYRGAQAEVSRPDIAVPPRNNTLVAFECTPFSSHSFITNPVGARNCLVMWLHRPRAEVISRWGAEAIVGWK